MKLKDKSIFDIKNEMKKIRENCYKECTFLHKNKRYVSLLNEYTKRVIGD